MEIISYHYSLKMAWPRGIECLWMQIWIVHVVEYPLERDLPSLQYLTVIQRTNKNGKYFTNLVLLVRVISHNFHGYQIMGRQKFSVGLTGNL